MPRKQSCTTSETQLMPVHSAIFGTVNFSLPIQSELHASSSPLECRERRLLQTTGKLKRDKLHWVSFTCGLGLLEVYTEPQSVAAEIGLSGRSATCSVSVSNLFAFLSSLKLDISLQIWKERKSHSFHINGITETLVATLLVPVSRDLK